tara:strand:- start:103 stop:1062 length:960 start_codon:yes stop_codon:yes gene_type:complete
MEFIGLIKELMLKYECLVIPDFGAFLARSYPAGFDKNSHFFYPKKKVIAFNGMLTQNDGILVSYLSSKKNIDYSEALSLIKDEVSFLKKRIKQTPVIIDEVGELSSNQKGKIIFNPYNIFNFELNSFGLNSFTKTPNKNIINPNKSNFLKMEKSNNEPLSFTPDKAIRKMTPLKYAAIGIISIIIVSSAFYFVNDYIEGQRLLSTQIGQNRIKNNVQKATFDIGSLSTMEISLDVAPKIIKPEMPFYSVIAGSFRNKAYAEKLIQTLKKQGYKAAYGAQSQEGLHRVAYGRFKSKKEALNLFYFVRYTLEEDAWYLEEK